MRISEENHGRLVNLISGEQRYLNEVLGVVLDFYEKKNAVKK